MAYVRALIEDRIIKRRVSGPAAERGTRIHTLGESIIKWTLLGKKTDSIKGDKAEIEEAREYAEYCVALFNEFRELVDPNTIWGAEDKAVLDKEFCWGRRDFWLYGANYLIVLDLKSGREPVTIRGNSQLLIYAIDKFVQYQPKYVELCVWQPNASDGGDHARSHVYSNSEMRALAMRLSGQVDTASEWFGLPYRKMEDSLVAGDHCGYCDALGVCPKAKKHAQSISKSGFEPTGRRR